jgi:hypothetical protein
LKQELRIRFQNFSGALRNKNITEKLLDAEHEKATP